jgi:hypothetical protein
LGQCQIIFARPTSCTGLMVNWSIERPVQGPRSVSPSGSGVLWTAASERIAREVEGLQPADLCYRLHRAGDRVAKTVVHAPAQVGISRRRISCQNTLWPLTAHGPKWPFPADQVPLGGAWTFSPRSSGLGRHVTVLDLSCPSADLTDTVRSSKKRPLPTQSRRSSYSHPVATINSCRTARASSSTSRPAIGGRAR